jgi:ABC-type branched-subunit amino acid transport system substrate-binding protein
MNRLSLRQKGAVLASALGCMLAMGSAASAADCTVKVGAVLPTSVDWGRPIAEIAQYAVDMANEAGGVLSCDVELILRDTQVDPKVGVDAAKALVDLDGVKVLLGAVSSGVSMPILTSVAVPSDVMMMSCCSSSTGFTALSQEGKTKGLFFRTFATSGVQAAVGAMVARDKGYKSVAILYKNDDWGQDISKLIAANLKSLGITVTASVALNDGQPSYRAEVTQALKVSADAVYLALYPTEGAAAIREWISLGGTQNMIMANSLKSDEFRDNVGLKYLANAVGTDTASPRTDSASAFVELYKAKFGKEPNGPGLSNSFDATMIALLATHAAGKNATGTQIAAQVANITDPKGVAISADVAGFAKALEVISGGGTVMYQGATGNVRFDANGDVSAPAVTWVFNEGGSKEATYITLEEVDAFMASVN